MTETIIKNPSWWCRRTLLEKSLLVFTIIFALLSLILCITILCYLLQKPVDICTTQSCVETSSNILKRMDRSIDPCNNFYQFACGSFINNTEIPKDKVSITSLVLIQDKVQNQIRRIVSEPIHQNETTSYILVKKFYNSCLDENKIELLGLQPIKRILSRLGGWPVIEGNLWDEKYFDWKNLTYDLKRHGFVINHLINLYIDTDIKKPKKRVLQLSQSNLDLSRELLVADISDRSIQAYFDFMIDIAMIFGANKTFAEIEMEPVLMFQRQLAEISLSQTELRNASNLYNPMFIEELQVRYPSIPWLEFINNILSPVIQVENEEIVINQIPTFITKLEALLKVTPKRTLANYLLWLTIKDSIVALPKQLRLAQLKFLRVAAGIRELQPRWKTCLSSTYRKFDLIIGSMYVRKYFNEKSKNSATEIFENIRHVFKDNLLNVDWMDDGTRKHALEKLDAMNANIGYPDELLNDDKINKIYEDVQIKENHYFESVTLLHQWEYNYFFQYLRKPVNKTDWVFHGDAATIGAFYTLAENGIRIPAGILQDIFFSNNRPNYMNYGGIGFIIAHEITHGFDNEGRQYNKDGMVVDWWDPKTTERFLKKRQCFIEQYNNYTVVELNQKVNGFLTDGENIADNGGIKEAYYAYKKWIEQNSIEPQLPGLPYSPEQMFWISSAQIWCSKERLQYAQTSLAIDTHAPNAFRVIGSFRNQDEFSADFNCPVGSTMNPVNKCRVW